MNNLETIKAAIAKLETLRDGATPGRWAYYNEPWGDIMSEQQPGLGVETSVAGEMSDFDGNLVVTLHRTIDAQIVILQETVDYEDSFGIDDEDCTLLLARAILGGEQS